MPDIKAPCCRLKNAVVALLAACVAAGCANVPESRAGQAPLQPVASLPDCFTDNYHFERRLFTVRDLASDAPNQQCVLNVRVAGRTSAMHIAAGRYLVSLSDGGDGGAGGTRQEVSGRGGGGGGGAGARELYRVVDLVEGAYKMTLGAGGPGGNACRQTASFSFSGGPGWLGSPTSLVRIDTNEMLLGTSSADRYARPTRAQNESGAGNPDAHGGSGFGKTHGGAGGRSDIMGFGADFVGQSVGASSTAGGSPGLMATDRLQLASGGGGGASYRAEGGNGGGELPRNWSLPPERGALGSGGGGGDGTQFGCSAGAPGGNGFIALRAYPAMRPGATRTVVP